MAVLGEKIVTSGLEEKKKKKKRRYSENDTI